MWFRHCVHLILIKEKMRFEDIEEARASGTSSATRKQGRDHQIEPEIRSTGRVSLSRRQNNYTEPTIQ
jgi:hypothetical protein